MSGALKLRSINPPEGFDSHPGHHFSCARAPLLLLLFFYLVVLLGIPSNP